jgi:translation initiation factor IF-2
VKAGFECGLTLAGFQDIKQGDVIEAFRLVEVARTLEG